MNFKIAIGIPNYGTITTKTALCLMRMMRLPYNFEPIGQYGAYVSENREKIAKTAIDYKFDYLLFIDHDIEFNPDLIVEMLNENKEIIGGMYNYRWLPKKPMVKFFKGKKTVNEINQIPSKPFKVAGIGAGFLLIKMSVFDKIKPPYFPMLYDKEGMVIRGEDIAFCEKARDAGIDIWCYPLSGLKHHGNYAY